VVRNSYQKFGTTDGGVDKRALQQVEQCDRKFGHECKSNPRQHHRLHSVFSFGPEPDIEFDGLVLANLADHLTHLTGEPADVGFPGKVAEIVYRVHDGDVEAALEMTTNAYGRCWT
jgi:hypothetical protein